MLAAALMGGACGGSKATTTTAAAAPKTSADAVAAAIASTDRTPDDRSLDAGRKPQELFTFIGLAPGMRAAELVAGGGYTTELMARIVGPTGMVFGENPSAILKMFAEKAWSARLDRLHSLGLRNIVRVDREVASPLPPEASNLDVVLINLTYHDMYGHEFGVDAMNKSVFAALKPGGLYVVVDHTGKPGSGMAAATDLHRIDPALVKQQVGAAGFTLDRSGDFLHHAEDTLDWNASPMADPAKRGTTDRFVFVFKKPAA